MDNAPCHRSRTVDKFLEDNGLKSFGFGGYLLYQRGRFSPNSPNLNPIEHVWSIIQESCVTSSKNYGRIKTGNFEPME